MKLAILGGGGFRTPLVYAALAGSDSGITEVALYDTDRARLDVMAHVLAMTSASPSVRALDRTEFGAVQGTNRSGGSEGSGPRVTTTTELDGALEGADFVFSAIRVGGLAARVQDERVALEHGLLGQETTGPGGIAYGLRTIPVARRIAERVAAVAPDAWVINFTNPAGMITEAMRAILGDRVVGICDTPITMAKRAARLLGVDPAAPVELDYVGLNHLGWLRALRVDGVDLLPNLIADDALLGATEEGQLFGLDWVRSIGALPNEYLYYYDFTRDAVASIRNGGLTRGEFLAGQQDDFYAAAAANPDRAHELWVATRAEREATYMAAEHAGQPRGGGEGVADVGGYEGVALALMRAIARDEQARMILDVANRGTVPGLPDDAVVEVPVTVGASGPFPSPVSAPTLYQLGLMAQVKSVERLTIDAAVSGSPDLAEQALARHPLVDSATVAHELLRAYRQRIPEVAAVFDR
ncbi:MAG TPA: 6-phospho-beta-glucosidase [Lapillicoccus sp.]|nr:6-phospho-beta-glucosidase [Lapillicoccus sp.]